jgi:hypothetical protein
VAWVVPSLRCAAVQDTSTVPPPPEAVARGVPGATKLCVDAEAAEAPVEDQNPNATLAIAAAAIAITRPMEMRRLI